MLLLVVTVLVIIILWLLIITALSFTLLKSYEILHIFLRRDLHLILLDIRAGELKNSKERYTMFSSDKDYSSRLV